MSGSAPWGRDRSGRGDQTSRVIRYLPAVVAFALAVFCLVDVIGAREPRNLPKWAWIVMILLFPLVGSLGSSPGAWCTRLIPRLGVSVRP